MKKQTLILFFIFTVIILFLHSPNVFLHKTFIIEDGRIFFTDAEKYGLLSYFIPYNGYYHTIIRILASIATPFPYEITPYIYLFYVIIVDFLTVIVTYKVFNLNKIKYGSIIAFMPLIVPVSADVYNNLTNTQWILAYFFAIIIAYDWAKLNKYLLSFVIFLLSLTGPFSIFIFPIVASKICIFKDLKNNILVYSSYIIGMIVQLLCVMNSQRMLNDSCNYKYFIAFCKNFIYSLSSIKVLAFVLFILLLYSLFKLLYNFKKNYLENFQILSLFIFGCLILCASIISNINVENQAHGILADRYLYLYVLSVLLLVILTFKNKYMTLFVIFSSLLSFSCWKTENIYWDQYVKFSKFQNIVVVPTAPSTHWWYTILTNAKYSEKEPDKYINGMSYFKPYNICQTDYIAFTTTNNRDFQPLVLSKGLEFFKYVLAVKIDKAKYKFDYILPVDNKEYKIIVPPDLKINCYCIN